MPPKSRRSSVNSERSSASFFRRKPEDDVFYSECEAAYMSTLSSTEKRIKTKSELMKMLQQGGRNPTQKKIDEIWAENSDISYKRFCDIMREIKPNTKDDLLRAFKKIDINGDGFITHSELYRVLTSRGEKMTKSEVKKIIEDGDSNRDGKLDYSEFCTLMLSTSQKCQQMNFKRMQSLKEVTNVAKARPTLAASGRRTPRTLERLDSEEVEESEDSEVVYAKIEKKTGSRPSSRPSSIIQPGSRPLSGRESGSRPVSGRDPNPRPLPSQDSSSRPSSGKGSNSRPSSAKKIPVISGRLDNTIKIKGPALMDKKNEAVEPKSVKSWNSATSKGCFYLDNDDGAVYAHQYDLSLSSASKIWLTSQPIVISQRQDTPSNTVDTPVMILRQSNGKSEFMAMTDKRDGMGKYYWQGDLRSGSYSLIPFTSGCRLQRRKEDPIEEAQLIRKDQNDEIQLSKVFRETLSDIFEMCDLDGNGLLSRSEFNWFQLLTSDEEVDDEAWQIVEDNFDMKKGELTREGFVQLHLMQAREEAAEVEEDLMDTLQCMGYNKSLDMDQACPFELSVQASDCSPTLSVESLSIGDAALQTSKMVTQNIIQNGEKQNLNLKKLPKIEWYVYKSDSRVSSVVRNASSSTVEINIDSSQMRNCVTCKRAKDFALRIVPNSNMLVDHAMPEDERQEWFYQCTLYDPESVATASVSSFKSSASKQRSSSKKGSLLSLF